MSVVELPVEADADARPPEYSDEALALRFATAHAEDLGSDAISDLALRGSKSLPPEDRRGIAAAW